MVRMSRFRRSSAFAALLLLIAACGFPLPAFAQTGLIRHPQPDGGSISIPANWVIAQLAAEAMVSEDGEIVQELVSARGFYAGTPVVLRSWRLSPAGSATLLVQGMQEDLKTQGMQLRDLPAPTLTPPVGMRTKVDRFSYPMGPSAMETLIVVCENDAVGHVLMISAGSDTELEFGPIRRSILDSWKPSKAIEDGSSMGRPKPMRTTARFLTGEQVVIDDGWQAIGQDMEVKNLTAGTRTLEHRRLLSMRRYSDPPSPTEILLLNRLKGTSRTDEAESMVTAEIQTIAQNFGGQARTSRSVVDPMVLEMSSQPLPNGLCAIARMEQRGGMTVYVLGFVADPTEGMTSARRLLGSFAGTEPVQTQPAPIQPTSPRQIDPADAQRLKERTDKYLLRQRIQSPAPPRGFSLPSFADHLGGVVGIGVIFALPALVAGVFSKRLAAWLLAFMVFVPGYFASYGSIDDALKWIDAQDAVSDDGPPPATMSHFEMMTRSSVGSWVFSLDTLGERIFAENSDPLSVLACRCARGDRGWTLIALGAIGVGSFFALIGPLLVRFMWIGQPFAHRRYAYLMGLAWLLFGVTMLSSLGSSSIPHRALVIGATLMTVLLLPRAKTAAAVGTSPPVQPPA